MKLFISIASVIFSFTCSASYAQLGAEAPLPKISKIEGPTLEVTTQWISNKFSTMSPMVMDKTKDGGPLYNGSINTSISRFFFKGCDFVTASGEKNSRGFDWDSGIYLVKGPLAVLNLREVVTIPWGRIGTETVFDTTVFTNGKREVLEGPKFPLREPGLLENARTSSDELLLTIERKKVDEWSKEMWGTVSKSSFSFRTPDMETAQSVINALKHASELCRQQLVDKAAAKPPKPKDLF